MQSTLVYQTYSDPFVFSNEAFYDFAPKVDFDKVEQVEPNRTPPPLPVAAVPTSPPTMACSCCAACRQEKPLPQQPQEPQYWQTFYSNGYYPVYQNSSSNQTSTPIFYTIYQEPSQEQPRTRAPRSEGAIPLLRTLQNRLIWTKSLQKRFLLALDYFGLDNGESFSSSPCYAVTNQPLDTAMPRAVLNYMNSPTPIPGLTRANISSHLQKHRKKIEKKKNDTHSSDDEDFDFEFEFS